MAQANGKDGSNGSTDGVGQGGVSDLLRCIFEVKRCGRVLKAAGHKNKEIE